MRNQELADKKADISSRVASMSRPAEPVTDRIRKSVLIDEAGCWIWQKFSQYGYGKMYVGLVGDGTRRCVSAHRASHEAFKGPIPDGYHVDHLCRKTLCVNPEHLQAVTPRLNAARRSAAQAGAAMCPAGHRHAPLTTVYVKGKRECRICRGDGAP
jgi:hypothetical protein